MRCNGGSSHRIKVKDALKIGGLKEARVLSGHEGLNNKIEHVDVIEMQIL